MKEGVKEGVEPSCLPTCDSRRRRLVGSDYTAAGTVVVVVDAAAVADCNNPAPDPVATKHLMMPHFQDLEDKG